MEPLPQTCNYCGICSTHYCITDDCVKKCSNKTTAYRRAQQQEEFQTNQIKLKTKVKTLVEKLDTRVRQGHGRGHITRAELALLRKNLKSGWQIFDG